MDSESEVSLTTETIAHDEREIVTVSKALDELPAEQRLALSLVAIDGKTYAEAADILEVPIGTIMSRIARARKNLVASLGDELPDMTNQDKT